MLVLTRKLQEQIRIGENVTITVLRVKGNTVRIGIEAPREIRVIRGELEEHVEATESTSDDAGQTEAADSPAVCEVSDEGVAADSLADPALPERRTLRLIVDHVVASSHAL